MKFLCRCSASNSVKPTICLCVCFTTRTYAGIGYETRFVLVTQVANDFCRLHAFQTSLNSASGFFCGIRHGSKLDPAGRHVFIGNSLEVRPMKARGGNQRDAISHRKFGNYACRAATMYFASGGADGPQKPLVDYSTKGWWTADKWSRYKLSKEQYLK